MADAKFIIVFDLCRYGIITDLLADLAGPDAVKPFNDRVRGLAQKALESVGVTVDVPYRSTGDGAIIALDSAKDAHFFAAALHEMAHIHNLSKSQEFARLYFRIGIARGAVSVISPPDPQPSIDPDLAGTAIAEAERFETACRTGEVLISENVWCDLKPEELRKQYGPLETIHDKHGQPYDVHRRKVVEPAPVTSDHPGETPFLDGRAATARFSPIGRDYLGALRFGKLVHHLFHTLDTMGIRDLERAARRIFRGASKSELPELIIQCQEAWEKSRDAREELDQQILQRIGALIPKVNAAFSAIMTNADRDTAKPITSSLVQLIPIQDAIAAYKIGFANVSAYASPGGGFSAIDPKSLGSFASHAMALSRTVDRLIAKADALIKNLLDAMEIDPRL